jgi:hypothetical protein
MAVLKSDLLQFVAQYQQDNKRPCPKSAIISTHGEDALTVLKELIDDKSINCRRGRNGGYFPTDTVATLSEESSSEEPVTEPVLEVENDVADQFAALQAKLAALEESEQTESEQASF